MPSKKGTSNPQTPPGERAKLVERICELYETQNATVESCCKSVGVEWRTFYLWIAQNSELAERYKKAKTNQDAHYWQDIIRPLAKTSLQRLLEGEATEDVEIRELAYNGVPTKDADGAVNTAKTMKNSKTQPNPTAVIFTLKGIYPDMFAERNIIDLKTAAPQIEQITPEQIAAIDKILNGESTSDIHAVPGERKGQK
jgi:hypothetical protein